MVEKDKMMILSKTPITEKYNKYIIDADQEDYWVLDYGVILQSFRNNIIKIVCQYKLNKNIKIERNREESQFSSKVLEVIADHCAFAATDSAVSR